MRLKQFSEKLQKTKKEVNVVETERKSRFSETYSGQVVASLYHAISLVIVSRFPPF